MATRESVRYVVMHSDTMHNDVEHMFSMHGLESGQAVPHLVSPSIYVPGQHASQWAPRSEPSGTWGLPGDLVNY